jgi:hypothetical protein
MRFDQPNATPDASGTQSLATADASRPVQTTEEKLKEQRQIRRLQMVVNMVMQVIAQDRSLTVEQASEMVADTRRAALAMFPGKELAYDLIYKPRLQRLMCERYRLQ